MLTAINRYRQENYLRGLKPTFCFDQREVGWGDSGSSSDFQRVFVEDRQFQLKIQSKHVFATISNLKNGKATGLNMIPNKILKCSKNVISGHLQIYLVLPFSLNLSRRLLDSGSNTNFQRR